MLIPILTVRDMPEAVAFYTEILDFKFLFAWPDGAPIYAGMTRGANEMHLSLASEPGRHGHCSAMVLCEDADGLFATYKARGLKVPTRAHSPVHEGPLEQTWGTREFYVDDPSGNTLLFQKRR